MTTETPGSSSNPVIVAAKPPVKAMWVCLILAWLFFMIPFPGTIFIAGPLNLAAFILAILCITRSRVGRGVVGLIGATVISAIAYIIGLALMGGLVSAGMQAQDKKIASEVATAVNVQQISVDQLLSEYKSNEVAADQKFKGKVLEIAGTVNSIGKDIGNDPYITLKSGENFDFRGVQCYFDKSQESQLANISKGQQITIRGMCSGLLGNVQIKKAQIVK